MNDTEIVDHLLKWMKTYLDGNIPAPPVSIGYAMTWIEIQRGDRRKAQDAPMGPCMICKQPFHGMQPCKTADAIKPQVPEFGSSAPKAEGSAVEGHPHSQWCDVLTTTHGACNCPAGNPPWWSRYAATDATSAAPTHAHADFCRLDTDHKGTCGLSSVVTYGGGPHLTSSDVWQLKDAPEPPVLFWRCKHYPIATHNWHEGLVRCRFGCDAEPTWDSNGMRT
jgi:hypothetical protein